MLPFAGVKEKVLREVPFQIKRFTAIPADERPVVLVLSHVILQIAILLKALATRFTVEWPFACVRAIVHSQYLGRAEERLAFLALKWLLNTVLFAVFFEPDRGRELLTTRTASPRHLPIVCSDKVLRKEVLLAVRLRALAASVLLFTSFFPSTFIHLHCTFMNIWFTVGVVTWLAT